MVRKGDKVRIHKNHDKRSNIIRIITGEVFGIYDRYFILESEKGYRESFLKCDIDIGLLTVKFLKKREG